MMWGTLDVPLDSPALSLFVHLQMAEDLHSDHRTVPQERDIQADTA